MFTSQSLRAVIKPGALVVREQRFDDVVHQLDVRGTRDAAYEVAHRPAQAANVDQAVMILKMMRLKTDIQRQPPRAKQRIPSMTLPRIEPTT